MQIRCLIFMTTALVFPNLASASWEWWPCSSHVYRSGKPLNSFKQWVNQPVPRRPPIVPKTDVSLPVLVIGAGPAGLAAMRQLKLNGVSFEAVERSNAVGGIYSLTSATSPAYDNLEMKTSKRTTEYPDFPMPDAWPDYISREQAAQYLSNYAGRFALNRHIRFHSKVLTITKTDHNTWLATFVDELTGQQSTKEYRGFVSAKGAFSTDTISYPTRLWNEAVAGGIEVCHSATYRNNQPYEKKRTLVFGFGNSGADIVAQVSEVASETYLAVRGGAAWVVPLYVPLTPWTRGAPADVFAERRWPVPRFVERWGYRAIQRLTVGDPTSYGFPEPDHDILDTVPVSNPLVPDLIRKGKIAVKSTILRIDGKRVTFTDPEDEALEIDAMIFATGYKGQDFPFLSSEYVDVHNPNFHLAFHTFHPTEPGIFILPELHAAAGVWPIYFYQAEAVAAFLAAEQNGSPRVAKFNRLRGGIPIDLKGDRFSKRDKFHVDHLIAKDRFHELANWFGGGE